MTLEAKLKDIQEKLGDDRNFPNESSISQGIVLPILQELNWDIFDTKVVRPESITQGKDKADFALYDDRDNLKVFIEVKRLGGVDQKAEKQVMGYAHDKKVQIAVLTDGRIWSFYLPFEKGSYEEIRVFKLDLSEHSAHSPQESSEVLQRYLERDRVVSGEARETARVILFLKQLPDRWKWMVGVVDEAIAKFELASNNLASALKDGIEPKPAQDNINCGIINHFHSLLREKISQPSSGITAQRTQPESRGQVSASPSPGASERKQSVHRRVRQVSTPPEQKARRGSNVRIKNLVILGRRYHCRNQSHAMAIVFKQLQKADDGFLQRFYEHPENQRKGGRRYLGRNLQELFGNNVDGKSSESVGKGWVISTNYGWEVAGSKSSKKEIIQLAADVAGLKLKFKEDISGKGIIVNLDR